MLVNTAMDTILFTSYTLSQYALSSIPSLAPRTTVVAVMPGTTAGAIHGLVGVPFDNVARYLEGGTASWRQALARSVPPECSRPVDVTFLLQRKSNLLSWIV